MITRAIADQHGVSTPIVVPLLDVPKRIGAERIVRPRHTMEVWNKPDVPWSTSNWEVRWD